MEATRTVRPAPGRPRRRRATGRTGDRAQLRPRDLPAPPTGDARHRTLAAAESFAHAPGLVAVLEGPDPSATLQPLAEEVRTAAGIDAIIVYRLDGTVITHSDTSQIGKHLVGPYAEAAEGKAFTRTSTARSAARWSRPSPSRTRPARWSPPSPPPSPSKPSTSRSTTSCPSS
ncbi:hypothetical protein [Kitasatospora purpeofusca]|uniref:hypothetical protein n=1 Tax=Kitasatospora purpeofusca TaxID=67352 RepID=UPI0035DCF125